MNNNEKVIKWIGGQLTVRVYTIVCTTLLSQGNSDPLPTPDSSVWWRSCNFLIRSTNVVLGFLDFLNLLFLLEPLLVVSGRSSFCITTWFIHLYFLTTFNILLLITFKLQLLFICAQAVLRSTTNSTCSCTHLLLFFTWPKRESRLDSMTQAHWAPLREAGYCLLLQYEPNMNTWLVIYI